mmetsp:Transcript_24530/g.76310  ORF Transcript_24530/g.76310 Transcript_24530/m.76310 type:complete len:262 (-) Transcript_24530:156-941(-)
MIRNGAAFADTCQRALATFAFSGISRTVPPNRTAPFDLAMSSSVRSRPTSSPQPRVFGGIVSRSLGPNQSQTACTAHSGPRLASAVVPSRAARWPPEDSPQTPTWSGSNPYSPACRLSQTKASRGSSICAGHPTSAMDLCSMLASAKPRPAIQLGQPLDLLPVLQQPPYNHMMTGAGRSSGKYKSNLRDRPPPRSLYGTSACEGEGEAMRPGALGGCRASSAGSRGSDRGGARRGILTAISFCFNLVLTHPVLGPAPETSW